MGWYPPPPPLDEATLRERREAGARTLEELDPELFAWRRKKHRVENAQFAMLFVGATILAFTFAAVFLVRG